jgi:subtilisin-like proprotein convertase family protein
LRCSAAVLASSLLVSTSPLAAEVAEGVWCRWTPMAIPDANLTGITSTIPIASGVSAAAVNFLTVYVAIEHTYVGDLRLVLTNPAAATRELATNPGAPCPEDDLAATFTDYGELTADQMCDTTPRAIHGQVDPVEPFYAYTPALLDGDWKLTVKDTASSDAGTLRGWCLLSGVLFYDGFESGDREEWTPPPP